MEMFQKQRSMVYQKWFYLFIISFLIGTLLMNFGSEKLLGDSGIFNNAAMNRLKYLEVEEGKFFRYVLSKRLKDYFFFGLLSTTYLGIASAYICIAWQGILTGMVITAAVIRFGLKGILLILAGFFPHQLLLIPAGVMMICWCYQNCSCLYFPSRSIWPVHRVGKGRYIRQLLLLSWIIGVVIIGCILESYVNPMLITDMAKIF